MIKHIFLFGWLFVLEANAQNAASVHLEDVVCQLKSYRLLMHTSDSLENRIRIYDDSIANHFPRHCTIGWDSLRWEKWNSDYRRMNGVQEELLAKYFLLGDSMNNEMRIELKRISEQYCVLNKIDLFFTSNDPPIFGIIPKDVSEEFETYILSLE